jgi:hypothetical protein
VDRVTKYPANYNGFDSTNSDVQARLGPKAGAWARLEGAQAQSFAGPSRSPHWRLGSGSAWLRPRLLAQKIYNLNVAKKLSI